jgi:hypothetical protein
MGKEAAPRPGKKRAFARLILSQDRFPDTLPVVLRAWFGYFS